MRLIDEIIGYFELCSLNADPTGKAKRKFEQYIKYLNDLSKAMEEQEPVKPIVEQYALPLTNTSVRFIKKYYCGICKEEITGNNVFCHKCGRKVKRDDSDRNGNA